MTLNRKKKNEEKQGSLRELWDNTKHRNIHLIVVPEGEEQENGAQNTFENIIAENFSNPGKETVTQVQEAQSPQQYEPKEKHTKTHCN